MKAMIFAAGIGSRLKELTHETPKCLIEVGGITMLERVVINLKAAGVTSVAINLHHHAEKVVTFVESRSHFGINVKFSHEQELLDTGGGLKKLRSFFEKERVFLIHNADIYCTANLALLANKHVDSNAVATLMIMQRPSSRGLFFDRNYRLEGWTVEQAEVPSGSQQLAFCGISAASGELFSAMEEEEKFSIIKTFLSASRSTQRVWGSPIEPNADWVDIGTPEHLYQLRQRITDAIS
jgi:NDP-sugar pyrophosphorylase family protein